LIPRERASSIEREFFPALIADGVPCFGWCPTAYWRDIGNPAAYRAAQIDLLQGLAAMPLAPPGQRRDGSWVDGGGIVEPGAEYERMRAEIAAAALELRTRSGEPIVAAVHRREDLFDGPAIEKIPGAEPLKLSPSMRRDKRVAVRFNLVARSASAQVKPEDYSRKFSASDNLRWSLSGETVSQNQQPLGKPAASTSTSGASGAR